MSETVKQLLEAHSRMLGRLDVANIEARRAHKDGRFEDTMRHARAASRRLRAAMRLTRAMRHAAGLR